VNVTTPTIISDMVKTLVEVNYAFQVNGYTLLGNGEGVFYSLLLIIEKEASNESY